jgi:hypothetical protein
MKILVSVLVFVTALTMGVSAVAEMNKEGAINMDGLFPPPKSDLSQSEHPGKPELVSPSFFQKISESKVTLEWKAVANAEAYHVQVATDPNFKWLVKEEEMYKGTTLEVSGLEAGKHYFWRVSGERPSNTASHTHGTFVSSMFATSASK